MVFKIVAIALACLVIALLLIFIYLISPGRKSKQITSCIDKVKFAHRGIHNNKENTPENSVAAFKKAIDLGFGIELDIRETKDNVIVVFHDDTLKRMCNDDRRVDELTLDQLQQCSLLKTNEKIPTLIDVLTLVNGKVPLLVEYKVSLPGSPCESVCIRANELLKTYNGQYAIESFNYLVLDWYKKHVPHILRGQLGMGMQCYDVALGKEEAKKISMHKRRMVTYLLCNYIGRPHFISYRWQDINFSVRFNKILGAKIACWTVTNKKDNDRLLETYDSVIFEGYLA